MPVYTYRREDGTTFDIKQSFSEDPLEIDPETGQKVYRVIQAAGVIFKGSGFYVTDNKGSSRVNPPGNGAESSNGSSNGNGQSNGNGNGSEAKATPAESTTAKVSNSTSASSN